MKKIEGRFFISIFSQLSSGDASDSICPKGWGIAGYSGDGSYQRLIANIYGANKTNIGVVQNYKEYATRISFDGIVLQSSFLFIHSGFYVNDDTGGRPHNRIDYGYIWENSASNTNQASMLNMGFPFLEPQNHYFKNSGMPLRCVAKSHFSLDFYAYL